MRVIDRSSSAALAAGETAALEGLSGSIISLRVAWRSSLAAESAALVAWLGVVPVPLTSAINSSAAMTELLCRARTMTGGGATTDSGGASVMGSV